MKYYDPFDCKVNCEELEQASWEAEQERLKNYGGGYQNLKPGPTYNGMDV